MALEVGHPAFIPAFWSLALKDNLKLWIDGHGAKVVAAVVRADTDAKTKKTIHTAVGKLVEGGDAMAWSDGFFRAREGEVNKTPSSKGKRSEPGKSATKGKKTKTPKK